MKPTPLAHWRNATGLNDVAALLGYKPGALAYILYRSTDSAKYSEFYIPKRDGSARRIDAPSPRLKFLQRRLADALYLILDEIEGGRIGKPLSHGFAKGLSIISNAKIHERRRYVFNFDMKDFFPSIHFGRVYGVFEKDKRFGFKPAVAKVIAQIACRNGVLPQGSPSSPVLSNIVANILDMRLVKLAKKYKCTYSRYADDLTFSTNKKIFPEEIAVPSSRGSAWEVGRELLCTVKRTGFEINPLKTRMQFRCSRQMTTGLLVNENANVPPEYYRMARAMCAHLFRTGTYFKMVPAPLLGGETGQPDTKLEFDKLSHLQGMLSHIYQVRVTARPTKAKNKNKHYQNGLISLYEKFLFYKFFVAPDRPLIVTEGLTDPIYIRAAMERLPAYHPRLGVLEGVRFKPTVRFLDISKEGRTFSVLQLGTGVSGQANLIRTYKKKIKRYAYQPFPQPVILLTDNDSGLSKITGALKSLKIENVSLTSNAMFYKLLANLYLVKTPERDGVEPEGTSCIENFFSPEVLDQEIRGKKLDLSKEHEEEGKYGKTIFAREVVRAQKTKIDFSGFIGLLDRIVAVLDDYNPPLLPQNTVAPMR